jgi:hypothetical protein
VSALAWLEADPTVLVVAPLEALAPGGIYTLGLGAPLVSFPFGVAADGPPPLARVWPVRDDADPVARAAVWCGDAELGPIDAAVTLEPGLVAGRFRAGTGASIAAPRCASWFSLAAAADGAPVVVPPSLALADGSSVALEPTLLFARDGAEASSRACAPSEVVFGTGCAEILDDRIVVTPSDDPSLYTIDLGGRTIVRASTGGQAFTLRPFPIDGRCRVATLARSGRVVESALTLTPAPPRPHVVLNEVMANPAGAEPAQEWVELYNDGAGVVALEGFGLEDSAGRTVLPAFAMEPGGFALVVADAFVADDGVDAPPAPGATIVRVSALGRGGLSNEGEKLTLRDPSGAVVSTFPAAKTKNGVSIARIAPDAPDTDPASFAPSPNGSSTPGAPNAP